MASEVTWQSNPPEKLLKGRFHITTGFYPGQRDIIEQLVQGKRLHRCISGTKTTILVWLSFILFSP